MKRIELLIRPFELDEVRETLAGAGIQGMTITEVRVIDGQKKQTEIYRTAVYEVDLFPRLKVEIIVPDRLTHDVTKLLEGLGKKGKLAEGKLSISEVEDSIRIRTEQLGDAAVS